MRPVVAAFDLDGTVTLRDSVVPFLRRVAGTVPVSVRLGLRPHHLAAASIRRDHDRLKAMAARAAFAGRPADEIERAGQAFAATISERGLRGDTVARMRWHKDQGHGVVLVSASFGAYVRPLGELLGVDGVLSTELVVDRAGRCTGEIVDANCRGREKVRRLHLWLDEHHGGRPAIELWAYGDSPGDEELLADADHAVWAGGPVTAEPAGERGP